MAQIKRDVYFSFFMFTADLRPDDRVYTKEIVRHMKALPGLAYTGFDLPIAPTNSLTPQGEVNSYLRLRDALDDAGLTEVKITTNVAATRTFNPSSDFLEQHQLGLDYLKSRVDITQALRGDIMAGPIVLPYGVFPNTDAGQVIWSDALQDWLTARYRNAQPIIERLGQYAGDRGVKVAIDPVDHWETPAPNLVKDVLDFLDGVASPHVGVCIDSAHVALGSSGPAAYTVESRRAIADGRLHYVHLSAPDRGAPRDSWIPWHQFLEPFSDDYGGPYLVEVFNAIPVFLNSLRLTRRKFLIPGEDSPVDQRLDAYDIAGQAMAEVRRRLAEAAKW